MPANITPIYTRVADVQWKIGISAARNDVDLSTYTADTDCWVVFTADATNGGYVSKIVVKVQPGTNSSATVMRVWLNNGSTIGTAANSTLIGELGIPATTASASAPLPDFTYPMNVAIPAGYRIYVSFGTDPGTCQVAVTCFGGKY